MRHTEDMIQSIGNEKFTGSIYLGGIPPVNANIAAKAEREGMKAHSVVTIHTAMCPE